MPGTVLILGATGRFGRNMAEAFWNRGWTVRLFDRKRDDLAIAAQGADVIVNGWNPPYHRWQAELPGQIDRLIDVTRQTGATLLQPGNVYVYGAKAPARLAPDTAHLADNPLGRLRVALEARLRDAGIPVILLRAGDFIDTTASGNWFDKIMAAKLPNGSFVYPGPLDRDHAWAFLPDLARAGVALCERRAHLPRFAEVTFPGYTLTGAQLGALVAQALGRPVAIKQMSWWPIQLARPVLKIAGGLLEMRYLWSKPHHLDGAAFDEMLPEFHPTEPVEALRQALSVSDATAEPQPVMG
ncbi:epimerase [Mesobacterium sp. TK19101]|uniref:Epimerase n=1 Tax=Mesobacterium hydrothermale TaxID=3111907 RepID=A0ABU6HE43_9RHOB|nr:epimerase [Mesobacterium sp. TK19101]MEC3860734.1 epimerase [Mesobacterium sp. TK19101]